jgi:hypothetical protein
MTTTQIDAPRTLVPAGPLARLATDSRYVVTGLPLAVAAFTSCVTGLFAGVGPALAKRFATAERARIAVVLDEPVPAPVYRTGGWLAALADRQTWRDLAHATLRWLPSTIAASFTLTWWAGAIGGLTWALWGWALPEGNNEVPELLGFGDGYGTIVAWYFGIGLLFAATLPAVARTAARLEAGFARALL